MARINAHLLERLASKTGLKERQVYRLIERKAQETALDRHLAAIALALDLHINVSNFASSGELAVIRHARTGTSPAPQPASPLPPGFTGTASKATKKKEFKEAKKRGKSVFVVHRRNEKIRKAMFGLLRALGLTPIEWVKAVALTGKGSPYIGEILDAAFRKATAVVVLLTPDDEARSKPEFVKAQDPPEESKLMGQARPNVLFEADMAFGRHPNNTVLVQVGKTRQFSDVGGRHVVHLDGTVPRRQELIAKLKGCGCEVDDGGSDWTTEG